MDKRENETNKKCCENCDYFIIHYINSNGKFQSIHFGHCIYEAQKKFYLKYISSMQVCDLWKSNSEKQKQVKKSITVAINNMATILDQYLQVLKTEKSE